MIELSTYDKNLWKKDSAHKELVISIPSKNITLTNEDLVSESMRLIESINEDTNLTFKGCVASQFSVDISNFMTDIRNCYIEVSMTCENSQSVPIFKGYVDTQSNRNHEDIVSSIVAYDAMKNILSRDVTAWYNGLTFPITIRNLRNSFFTYLGVQHESVNLANDSFSITKEITDPTITGDVIIRSICELNGVFGQIDRYGVFRYRKFTSIIEGLYPKEDLYPSETLYPRESNASEQIRSSIYKSINYQPYEVSRISKVIIVNKNGQIQGQAGDTSYDTFYVSDNPIAWGVGGNANTVAQNLLNVIDNIVYTPATIDTKGLPYMECGDIVVANTHRNVVTSYILTRTLSGIQSLSDNYESDSDQFQKEYKLSTKTEISTNVVQTQQVQSNLNTTNYNLGVTNGNLTTLSGTVTQLGTLVAQKATITDLNATNAKINSLNTTVANINRAYISRAEVNTLVAGKANVGDLNATNAYVNNLGSRLNAVESAYITEATVKRLIANSISANWSNINAMNVNGHIGCGSLGVGGQNAGWCQHTVRSADGKGTQMIKYLGAY